MIFLGIDAGASHSEVVIAGADLVIRARAEGPPAAVRPSGAAVSAAIIAHTARRAATAAGSALPGAAAVVGAAGAGRVQEQAELASALVDAGVAQAVRVVPDGEVALIAVFGRGPGVVVSAGTGSIAYARDAEGRVYRAGGYGWQIGDEGGGYWLGRRALSEAARTIDGLAEGSTLSARLLSALGLERFDALVRWAQTATPTQIAALAPHVLNAAEDGEAVARRAVNDAGRELAALVVSLERYFPGADPIPVAVAGSLLNPRSPLATAFWEALGSLSARAQPVLLMVDPAVAALRMAVELRNNA
ncbi:MAG TPA: BadF/BadG/BcrA/BcrD ATPase family protein [Gemmatimonadales bacterium]|nr:BadF/BadG/BcrA/BcrD ATPase family protein [Gemmatimonadales bacterium]